MKVTLSVVTHFYIKAEMCQFHHYSMTACCFYIVLIMTFINDHYFMEESKPE